MIRGLPMRPVAGDAFGQLERIAVTVRANHEQQRVARAAGKALPNAVACAASSIPASRATTR